MKILYYIDSLNIGGAEKLLLEMLDAYREEHEIRVGYFTEGPLRKDVEAMGIATHRLSYRGLKDPLAIWRSLQLIREFKPDVIHTHLSKSDLLGQLTGGMLGVSARVSSIHNVDPWRKHQLFSRVMRVLTARCQKLIAVSAEVRTFTLKWSRYPDDKIIVIDNGIDLTRFDPAIVKPIDLTQFGVPADATIIGIVGRLLEQKGHDFFLDMAHLLAQTHENLHFLVIGDGALREALEMRTQELGLASQVTFTGFLDDVPAVLASLDIMVFSSRWEGLPVALLEGMAMQRPMVVTEVGGIPGVVVNQENGLLVPAENAQALADACSQILQNPDLKKSLGQQARATIQRDYDQQNMHQKILNLYTELLEKR